MDIPLVWGGVHKRVKKHVSKFARNNAHKFSNFLIASRVVSLVFVFALVPTGILIPNQTKASDLKYETALKFNPQSVIPVASKETKLELISGPSKLDLERYEVTEAARSLDPEALKKIMQDVAPEYGVDWRLVFAIGYHESGNFTSSLARRQFNFFGRKANSYGYAAWGSPEEAIRNQFEYLKTRYFDRGLTTPASINRVYAEDQSWHYRVEAVMARL